VTGDDRATTINQGARESVRQLTAQFAGWLIAYHAGRDEFSATRPGLLIVRHTAAALTVELSRWEAA
jgi:hypothetical protein